jgi:hypothetical protein
LFVLLSVAVFPEVHGVGRKTSGVVTYKGKAVFNQRYTLGPTKNLSFPQGGELKKYPLNGLFTKVHVDTVFGVVSPICTMIWSVAKFCPNWPTGLWHYGAQMVDMVYVYGAVNLAKCL